MFQQPVDGAHTLIHWSINQSSKFVSTHEINRDVILEGVNHLLDPSLPMTTKRMTLIFILHMNRNLYHNQFAGPIPSTIGELTRLEVL